MATETRPYTTYPLGPVYRHGENPERDRIIDMLAIEFGGGYVTMQQARDFIERIGIPDVTHFELVYAYDKGQGRWNHGPQQSERIYWANHRALEQLARAEIEEQ